MRKVKTEKSGSIKQGIGFLLVAFAAIDFLSSFSGVNMTPFLGPVSAFSPMIFGSIGYLLISYNK